MWRSWKLRLGSAFGIGIYAHWTLLLLPLVVIWRNWSGGGLLPVWFLLLLVAGVFTCVVLHELGHALMARYFGIQTRDITLYPIGGVASLERLTEDPIEEIYIALAGPAVNLVIAAGLVFLGIPGLGIGVLMGASPVDLFGTTLADLLVFLLMSNLVLAAFNLIPAFPMDGGRVLRALLALRLGQLRATEIAAPVGMVVAGLVAVGIILGSGWNPLLIVLLGFVIFAGQRELAALRYREAQRRAAAQAVPAGDEILDVLPATEETGFSGFVWDGRTRAWVVWQDGRRVGTFGAWSE
jgi:Zn-dependent protease